MSRIALVTGGGTGIGASIAVALAEDGWTVVVCGRRLAPLEAVASAHPTSVIHPLVADVTDELGVSRLFEEIVRRFGRLDLLVNNAGRGGSAVPVDEVSSAEWRAVVDLNVTGTFLCTREAFRTMRHQEPCGGRILNNGSISAHVPRPMSIAYTTTKHAVTGLTKATALDGRPFNISCGQFDVGNASTEMTAKMSVGVLQADGTVRPEPTFPVEQVGAAVAFIANLPLGTSVPELMIAATGMPFIGRG